MKLCCLEANYENDILLMYPHTMFSSGVICPEVPIHFMK